MNPQALQLAARAAEAEAHDMRVLGLRGAREVKRYRHLLKRRLRCYHGKGAKVNA